MGKALCAHGEMLCPQQLSSLQGVRSWQIPPAGVRFHAGLQAFALINFAFVPFKVRGAASTASTAVKGTEPDQQWHRHR